MVVEDGDQEGGGVFVEAAKVAAVGNAVDGGDVSIGFRAGNWMVYRDGEITINTTCNKNWVYNEFR